MLAQDEWWRETCILALWLDTSLHTPDYLFALMGDAAVDLRVRVAAATILGEVGDPRFVRQAVCGRRGGDRTGDGGDPGRPGDAGRRG